MYTHDSKVTAIEHTSFDTRFVFIAETNRNLLCNKLGFA